MQVDPQTAYALKQIGREKGHVDIPSNGASMFPLIRTGNICRFVPLDLSELKAGDILLFLADTGELVGHRFCRNIVENHEILFICKGDANPHFDLPIRPEQILGKMVVVKKTRCELHMESFIMRAWGKAVLKYPRFSRWIHLYLKVKRKWRGMNSVS